MLQPNRQNPKLSAFEALWGTYSFDATPMTPPGTKCHGHNKAKKHASWEYHTTNAYYPNPKLDHYQCYELLVQVTGAICTSDTIIFNHQNISLPLVSNANQIIRTPSISKI